MTSIVFCGLGDAAVERIDAETTALGPSRNEFLRRRLEAEAFPPTSVTITADDWSRSAAAFGDLDDPAVMEAAWPCGAGSSPREPDRVLPTPSATSTQCR